MHACDKTSALTPAADEAALIERAVSGDARALRDLYDRYQPLVRAFLYRMLGPDPELDDLTQTVFTRAFLALDRFRGDSKLSTWLYQICGNTCRNLLRTRYRRRRLHDALHFFTVAGENDRERVDLGARDEALRLLQRLRPELREVFVLYHHEGLTIPEISRVLEVATSTVGDRLKRARELLHKHAHAAPRSAAPGRLALAS
ncbi:MAG: sigma-70 family RNA polymerase sigma factor [Myxococcales bacterium]|nr:sigma-70 family RNA polymerase sigma factor [Myxococcales bacterium]